MARGCSDRWARDWPLVERADWLKERDRLSLNDEQKIPRFTGT
jgi:hypothetical protein